MHIYYTSKFARQYKKLPTEIKELAEKRELIFRKNPFDLRLKTHKLSGKLEGVYSFSVNYSYRVIFKFMDEKKVRFFEIGTHDIYD